MHDDMNARFNDMDNGEIGKYLQKISKQFTRLVDLFAKSQEKKK